MNILKIKKFVLDVVDSSKKLETICSHRLGDFFVFFNYLQKKMFDNTYGSIFFYFFSLIKS